MEQAWDNYFHIGETPDLPFGFGLLLYEMGYFREAMTYFERSLALHGEAPATLVSIGTCLLQLGDPEAALRRVEEALALDPAYESARSARVQIRAQLQRERHKRVERK